MAALLLFVLLALQASSAAPNTRALPQEIPLFPLPEVVLFPDTMRVVVHRQAEVIGRRLVRFLDDVLAPPKQLDDAQREIGKAFGIASALCKQPLLQRATIGRRRELCPGLSRERDDTQPAFRHVLAKLDAENRAQAAVRALARGVVSPEDLAAE